MTQIQARDGKCNNVIDPQNDIHFHYTPQTTQEMAWIEMRDEFREEFRKRYMIVQSDIKVDAMGKYGFVPRYYITIF